MEALRRTRARRAWPLDAAASGRPFLGHLRRHADAVRRLARVARRRRARRAARHGARCLPDGVKRPQMQWNVLDVAPADARCSPALDDPAWVYFVHSYAPSRRRRRGRRHLRLRRPRRRRRRARQRVGHAVPPREVGRQRASRLLANFVDALRGGRRRDGPLPGHRPARRAGACASYQGDYDRETVYGDDPVAAGAGVRRRGRAAGSTSSTSTPPAPASRSNRPVDRRDRRGRVGVPVQTGGGRARRGGGRGAGRGRRGAGSSSAPPRSRTPTSCAALAGRASRSRSASTAAAGEVARAGWARARADELLDVAPPVRRRRRRRGRRHRDRRDGTLEGPDLDGLRAGARARPRSP